MGRIGKLEPANLVERSATRACVAEPAPAADAARCNGEYTVSDRDKQMGGEEPTGAGPAEINDPRMRLEARRAFVWIAMVCAVALVVILSEPLLVIFGGMVFAGLIDGGARLIGRVLHDRARLAGRRSCWSW